MLPLLAELGWKAEVLCVDAAQVEGPRDELLERTLPAGVRVLTNAVTLASACK